jgi:hypothetical protein
LAFESHLHHLIKLALKCSAPESSAFFTFEFISIGPFPFELAISLMSLNEHLLA